MAKGVNTIPELAEKIRTNVEKVIIGKSEVIDVLITSLIAGGHVLLEDVPGTGKTVLAKAISKSIGVEFKRVQFTPDLLPSDLTGINYYNQKVGEFTFRKGPIFTHILLADEINRATPRTQSSLLECMEERQVTIDGTTHKLADPFFTIATENPVETLGTFPLPEAQLDRFFVKLNMGYPTLDEGMKILERFIEDNPLEDLQPVCSAEDIMTARKNFTKVHVGSDVREYILRIIQETLGHDSIVLGVSPRGSLALLKACQSFAAVKNMEFVRPDDVKKMARYVLPHRIILKDHVRIKGIQNNHVIEQILAEIPAPTENWQ